jgi:hypothetical protein
VDPAAEEECGPDGTGVEEERGSDVEEERGTGVVEQEPGADVEEKQGTGVEVHAEDAKEGARWRVNEEERALVGVGK